MELKGSFQGISYADPGKELFFYIENFEKFALI